MRAWETCCWRRCTWAWTQLPTSCKKTSTRVGGGVSCDSGKRASLSLGPGLLPQPCTSHPAAAPPRPRAAAVVALLGALDEADWSRKLPQLADRLVEFGPSHVARLKVHLILPPPCIGSERNRWLGGRLPTG